jgi:hypothetical protein
MGVVRAATILAGLAFAGAAAGFVATAPSEFPANALGPRQVDVSNGETMFNAGGCAS